MGRPLGVPLALQAGMGIRTIRRRRRPSPVRTLFVGAVGGLLGGFAMNTFTRVVSSATGGHEAEGAAPGRERVGRGMQPPQAEVMAEDDAAVRVGSAVYEATTGMQPGRERRLRLGVAAHYAFSAAMGVVYMLAANRPTHLRRGFGGAYGALVWATADELAMPALGLSRGPMRLTPGMHAYSLAGHWIYGATLESVRRLAAR
jgi:uncharacterized membrane protein YagU involved in acid resistance